MKFQDSDLEYFFFSRFGDLKSTSHFLKKRSLYKIPSFKTHRYYFFVCFLFKGHSTLMVLLKRGSYMRNYGISNCSKQYYPNSVTTLFRSEQQKIIIISTFWYLNKILMVHINQICGFHEIFVALWEYMNFTYSLMNMRQLQISFN